MKGDQMEAVGIMMTADFLERFFLRMGCTDIVL
jgi:hypothetical protein